MIKILKLTPAILLASPLIVASCSTPAPLTLSEINIDALELKKNFSPVTGDPKTISQLISDFVKKFNENPEFYFIPSSGTPPIAGVTPFINATPDNFALNNLKKPMLNASISASDSPTFETIKFQFQLTPTFTPKTTINFGPSENLINEGKNAFSLQFRTIVPTKNSPEMLGEISWIHRFFSSSVIVYKDINLKNELLSFKPSKAITLINDRVGFEKFFKFSTPFPFPSITGWNYTVTSNVVDVTSIELVFTISNDLFTGENALTPAESMIRLVITGFQNEGK